MNLFDRLCFHRILLLRCLVSFSRNLCTLRRKHLIGHDHICDIHRSLVRGFAPVEYFPRPSWIPLLSFQHLPLLLQLSHGLLAVFQQIKHLKDNSSRQNPLVIVGFLGWPYYISSPGTGNRNFIVLFHNPISSWNSSYLYGRLILSRAIYIKQCVHRAVVIIFLTVIIFRSHISFHFSDHHWIFCVDLSWATHSFRFNWNFMVDTFIPAHQQSAVSYCHNSLSHFSIFQSADPYCHNLRTSLLC